MLVGAFAAQALLVMSGILSARILGPEGRGYLAFLVLAPVILATVGGLGLPQALTYWTARDPRGLPAVARAIAPAYVIQLAGLTLINLVVFMLFVWPGPAEVVVSSVILLVATPAILTTQYAVAIAQGKQRFALASALLLLGPTLYVAGLLVLAVSGQGHLVPIAAAWSLAYACAAVVGLVVGLRGLPAQTTATKSVGLRQLLAFGLRGLPSIASPLQTLRLDQLAVWVLLGPVAMGLYVVALALTNLPLLLAIFMGLTISGKIAAHTDPHVASRSLGGMVAAVAAVSLTIAVLLGVFAPGVISLVFGPEFVGAAGPTRILLLGAVAASVQRSIGDGLRAMGDPAASTLGEAVSWIALVPGMVILPAAMGLDGVAGAVALSYCAGLATVALRWYWRRPATIARHIEVGASLVEALPGDPGAEQIARVAPIDSVRQD